jgi:hypothetical protein
MPIRVINIVKRKPGMTHEEFRRRYETGHSRLALKMFGHLWTGYRRYYIKNANSFLAASGIASYGKGQAECACDAISEVIFPDMRALEESNRIASISENKRILEEDEATLFDRPNCWVAVADTVEDDPPTVYAELNRQ